MSNTILLPLQPEAMTPAQLAAVSYLARYSGHTHELYAYQLRRWFAWCETNRLDPLVGIQGSAGSSASPTSTASSPPTRPSTHACPRCTKTRPAPRAWTGSS